MVDYKPQFKPIYSFSQKSLVEKISDTFWDSFKDKGWRELKDDYIVTTSKDFRNSIDNIVNNKAANIALLVGMTTSMAANIFGAHYANQQGYDRGGIEWLSLAGEVAVHAGISIGAFIIASRSEGISWMGTFKRLGKVGLVTTPITWGPYALARNHIADSFMLNGMPPEGATPLAQLALIVPYALTVNYALKLVKYADGKKQKESSQLKIVKDEKLTKKAP
jgi:hypothetical protein